MEYFDLLDCSARKTGELISREDAHRSGAWHGAFHCLTVYEREGRGRILFQKRSAGKKIAPGKFDVSVGGHYSAGEDARIAGPREIREELGLDVRFEELLSIGRRVFVYCFSPGIKEYEFQDVFLLHRPVRPAEIRFQKEEVDGLLEMVDVDEGIRLFSEASGTIECRYHSGRGTPEAIRVSVNDFVPCLDNYYLRLLLCVQRYLRGEQPIVI